MGDVVGNLVQGIPHRQSCRDFRDGEAGGFRRQSRGTRHPRIHLDNDNPARGRLHRELNITAPGIHPNFANHRDTDVAQLLQFPVRQSQSRSHGDGITGVHPYRVEVFDGANHHDIVFLVAHQLQLIFFPTQDGFFQEDFIGQ